MAKTKLIGAVAAFGLLAGAASAATSGTTVTGGMNPFSTVPATGYISATVTATGAPVLIALPSTSKTVNTRVCETTDSSGNQVPRKITVSGTDLAIASADGGQTSGTIAVGDRIKCFLSYER